MEFKRRRPERFRIYWDNGEDYLFSPESVVKYGLSLHKEFNEEDFRQILQEDGVRRAKDQILKYLTIRPHSRKEIFLKTLRKGYMAEIIEQALDDLQGVGLIDDQAFARQFLQHELLLHPCGKNLLRDKLLDKGVSPAVFQPILDELYAEQPQEEIIKNIARKFLNKKKHLPEQKRTEKLIRHLQSKGFEWEMINWVLFDENIVDSVED